ncbi:MAG TPA: hypothetical protein VFI27_10415 [candidate division Zixibacteria bacterium]|nr:hypothetical protein [candidate division Zixibacteria bacterium]
MVTKLFDNDAGNQNGIQANEIVRLVVRRALDDKSPSCVILYDWQIR